jgi:RHS repeat-associated protein
LPLINSGGTPNLQRTFTFSYDDRHQLTYADDDTGGYTGQFEFRPSGRLDRAFIASVGAPMAPPRDVDYVYATAADRDPEAIQRLSSNVGAAPILYTSDESGNIASRDEDGSGGLPSFKFIYDGDDQQRRVTAPSLENELYYYDHTGQRVLAVTRLQNGTITRTRFWHGSLEVEYPQSGPVETTVHLSLGANPVARITNRVTARRVIHNHLGHFLAAFTPDGQALDASFIYGPFGEILAQSGTTEDYLRRFNGKEQDQLSDLSYYGYRYFDPLALTWTQADPLYRFAPDAAWDEPRRANLYAFSLNSPVRFMDPDGKQGFDMMLPPGGNEYVNAKFKEGVAAVTSPKIVGRGVEVAGDAISVLPGVGVAGDAISTAGAALQGDWGGVAIGAAAVILPGLGSGEVKAVKAAAEEGLERVAKESLESGATRIGRRTSQIDRKAFAKERAAYWKNEAQNAPGKYSKEDLAKMQKGRPPLGPDGFPMELHHSDQTPQGGLEAKSRTDHRLGENYKKNHPPPKKE